MWAFPVLLSRLLWGAIWLPLSSVLCELRHTCHGQRQQDRTATSQSLPLLWHGWNGQRHRRHRLTPQVGSRVTRESLPQAEVVLEPELKQRSRCRETRGMPVISRWLRPRGRRQPQGRLRDPLLLLLRGIKGPCEVLDTDTGNRGQPHSADREALGGAGSPENPLAM